MYNVATVGLIAYIFSNVSNTSSSIIIIVRIYTVSQKTVVPKFGDNFVKS